MVRSGECVKKINSNVRKTKSNDHIGLERIRQNKILKEISYAQGLTHFDGDCKNCGKAKFEIHQKCGYVVCRCVSCRKVANAKYQEKINAKSRLLKNNA